MTTKLLTADEVADLLGLKPARVYELTREKKLPFVLIGERQYRYSAQRISEWILYGGNQQQSEVQNENQ